MPADPEVLSNIWSGECFATEFLYLLLVNTFRKCVYFNLSKFESLLLRNIKAYSHRTEVEAKAKFCSDLCH